MGKRIQKLQVSPIVKRYVIAIVSAAAGLLARSFLWEYIAGSVPYITFFPAVIFSASRGGFGAGIVCTGFSAAAAVYFLIEPRHTLLIKDTADALGLVLFCGVGGFISWLTDSQRKEHALAAYRLRLLEQDAADRKHSAEALRQSNEELNAIVQASPLPIVALDGSGAITLWNPSAEHVFGWTSDEVLGNPLPYVPAELQEEHKGLLARVLSGERFSGLELRRRRKDGTLLHLSVSIASLRDGSGRVTGVMNIFLDITQNKQAEAALRLAHDRLHRANRELEEFTFISSHDLQEPLRMVNLYTQMLVRKSFQQDSSAQEYAGYIRSGVETMQKLIRDALEYSRVLHEDATDAETTDLNVAFHSAELVLALRVSETNAVIKKGPLPRVLANERQLAHVFQNLLDNAIKYRKPDEQPRIEVAAERSGTEWVIAVRDNGIGFQSEYGERIFGLFRRLHRNEEIPGTGLGLALSKRIVERYGGTMWAAGKPGAGATLYFSLPASDATELSPH